MVDAIKRWFGTARTARGMTKITIAGSGLFAIFGANIPIIRDIVIILLGIYAAIGAFQVLSNDAKAK